jgi:CheY-like chemotaxis protein
MGNFDKAIEIVKDRARYAHGVWIMPNVMVVEDNVDFRETLCGALQKRLPNISLSEIGNGRRALEMAGKLSPDVILMDIVLPFMNGLEVTRNLKNASNNPWIIILTGNDLPEYMEASQTAGADYFLSKNCIRLSEITNLVQDILTCPQGLSPKWDKFRIAGHLTPQA